MGKREENRGVDVVETYLARHAAADLEGVLALFAEEAELEDPVGTPAHRGSAALRAFYAATHARNGPLRFERFGPALVGGDEVAVHVCARLAGSAAGSATDVIYVFRVGGDGRILRLRAFF